MAYETTFDFEEIELAPGIFATGRAEISFDRDGDWTIGEIETETWQINGKGPRVTHARNSFFEVAIRDKLESKPKSDSIDEHVEGELRRLEDAGTIKRRSHDDEHRYL